MRRIMLIVGLLSGAVWMILLSVLCVGCSTPSKGTAPQSVQSAKTEKRGTASIVGRTVQFPTGKMFIGDGSTGHCAWIDAAGMMVWIDNCDSSNMCSTAKGRVIAACGLTDTEVLNRAWSVKP